MRELIARLESAVEGSRELDAEIWWHANPPAATRAYWSAAMGMPKPLGDEMPTKGLGYLAIKVQAPLFSQSLDAAMTLVPNDCDWSKVAGTRKSSISVHRLEGNCLIGVFYEAIAPTPALAICIAALTNPDAVKKWDDK